MYQLLKSTDVSFTSLKTAVKGYLRIVSFDSTPIPAMRQMEKKRKEYAGDIKF